MNRLCFTFLTVFIILSISCHRKVELFVKGIAQPLISLNGTWSICLSPYENIAKTDQDSIQWIYVEVPGECMMQGIPVRHDQPFVCTREFMIPSDYQGKLIKIRFEGVYSYARVWVNGNFIRDHSGGFTAWECDITSSVKPGEKAILIVEITDMADEISYASGYAKHQIGGILRNVSLLALPENYPEYLSVTTDLDDKYENAVLTVEGVTCRTDEECMVALELYDSRNRKIELQTSSVAVSGADFKISNVIIDPLKWNSEHPDLYRMKVIFSENGIVTWQKYYSIGFREIEVSGNKFLVNGKQIKLRGACRHDIHPLLGRLSTPEYDLKDVLLAKEANINFIRTSHYPPSEKFLELCDQYGIYVEDETAVCFVGSHRTAEYLPGSSESSPEFTDRYTDQLKEMVTNHRNHPSVIIWSIGNENKFGTNFKKSYDWVKSNDPTRPVIFSYPGNVPDSIMSYDILSMHYPGIKGNMNQYGITIVSFGHEKMPVLFDEWAHVPCYNIETVSEDPNIRDFWGISLDSMWQRVFESDGGLGGAIWGMIDETFMLPVELPGDFKSHTVGYGEWGIADTWRRRKPEFWSVKKAYSPVRVLRTQDYYFISGKPVEIPVFNRFDFTNLSELTMKLRLNGRSYSIVVPDIPPHSRGNITAEIDEWPSGEQLYLDITDKNDNLIDSYALSGKTASFATGPSLTDDEIGLAEEGVEYIIICNNNLRIRIDRTTGLFTSFETASGKKQFNGPYINLRILRNGTIYPPHLVTDLYKDWKLNSFALDRRDNAVIVSLKGNYSGKMDAEFTVSVFPDGTISSQYRIENIPEGNLREFGIKYVFDNDFDTLSWKRKPYWSTYPEGHLSGPEGIVPLYTSDNKIYREIPGKEWQYDKKSFFYNGIENETIDELVNIARATKENIFEYRLNIKGAGKLIVCGNGDKACRIEKNGNQIHLNVSDLVDYPDIKWGDYYRNIILANSYSGKIQMAFR